MRDRTLLLPGRDIVKLIDMRSVLRITESVFAAHANGRTQMPSKIYIDLERYRGDFRAMPAYVGPLDACGIKWVNVHPLNRRLGLPTVMAMIVLNDAGTGYPLAVMDGRLITSLRTGAAGGVAAKYMARRGSSRIGMVGCGEQALYQLKALSEIFRIKELSLYDSDPAQERSLRESMRRSGVRAGIAASIRDCVADKDIVVTTTPSRRPIVKSDWISPGTHINAIGADAKGKEELEVELLKRSRIVVDDMDQAAHSGEVNVPISEGSIERSDIAGTIGQVIAGARKGRTSPRQITIFDSTGLAILDVAVASHVYKRALRRGGFRKISFI